MSQQADDNMAYIARKPCGCIVAAMVDSPDASEDYRNDLARETSSWIRDGLAVARVTCQYVRDNWGTCTCDTDLKSLPLFANVEEG